MMKFRDTLSKGESLSQVSHLLSLWLKYTIVILQCEASRGMGSGGMTTQFTFLLPTYI